MNRLSIHLCWISLLISISCFTQETPPFLVKKEWPSFELMLTDSIVYKSNSPNPYPFYTLIYFSPDCGHCIETTEQIIQKSDSLQNTLLIMAAYKPLEELKIFTEKYHLNLFPNIRVGRDGRYFIVPYFRISYTPFVAVFDDKRKLIRYWSAPEQPFVMSELLEILQRK